MKKNVAENLKKAGFPLTRFSMGAVSRPPFVNPAVRRVKEWCASNLTDRTRQRQIDGVSIV